MDPITAGLGVASLAGQIFGAIKGGQANRANQDLLNKQREDNEKFYNMNVNRDFLETNAAKGMFEQLRKQFRDRNKVVENTAAVTGGTAEAEIAAKSSNQENYNDAVNSIAQNATGYQQGQEAIYRGQENAIDNRQMDINTQKAQNAANVFSNAGQLMGAASTLPGFEDLQKKYSNAGAPSVLGNIQPFRGQTLGQNNN